MQSPEFLQRHLSRLFVITEFLGEFSGGLANHIATTILATAPTRAQFYTHSGDAAVPLASILGVAQDICAVATVTDEESLADMLAAVRKQFSIVDECTEADATFALEILEHVFALASKDAREALREVQAGLPASGGDFAVWKWLQLRAA